MVIFCLISSGCIERKPTLVSEFFERVLVVIVVYKKRLQETPAFESIAALQSDTAKLLVYVYDNSPMPQEVNVGNVFYFHDQLNSGVSRAYNMAFEFARKAGKKWMLLLDQDSQIPLSTFAAYPVAVGIFNRQEVFVCEMKDEKKTVSPYRVRFGKGWRSTNLAPGTLSFDSYYVINSGMLITVDGFAKAGGYDPDFPLDLSDVVFCDRLKVHEKSFVLVNGKGIHALSANDPVQSAEQARSRFTIFCDALFNYKAKYNSSAWVNVPLLSRALRLSIHHRHFFFLKFALKRIRKPA
jgi:GT2 family glycosyltransferase